MSADQLPLRGRRIAAFSAAVSRKPMPRAAAATGDAVRLRASSAKRRPCRGLVDEPDCPVAHLDREGLQCLGTGRRLDCTGERLERALGTPHHLSGADVVQRCVPWALQAAVLGHASLTERGEQVAAAVGYGERLARADADCEGAVGCLLYHGDLGATEILDGDQPGSG